jgi:hypothetical protein
MQAQPIATRNCVSPVFNRLPTILRLYRDEKRHLGLRRVARVHCNTLHVNVADGEATFCTVKVSQLGACWTLQPTSCLKQVTVLSDRATSCSGSSCGHIDTRAASPPSSVPSWLFSAPQARSEAIANASISCTQAASRISLSAAVVLKLETWACIEEAQHAVGLQ